MAAPVYVATKYKVFKVEMMSVINIFTISAVRHDRMRGGRNKFGPMYKRDRARKLQVGERFVVNIQFYIIKSA